jgi:anti-anti-sigma factor
MAAESQVLAHPFEVPPDVADRLASVERRRHPRRWDGGRPGRHSSLHDAGRTGPDSRLTIAVGRALGTVVVTLRGELEEPDAPRLRAILADLINNQGNLDVVVDLRRLAVATPSGVAALESAAAWAAERGGDFRLNEPSPPFREALGNEGLAYALDAG